MLTITPHSERLQGPEYDMQVQIDQRDIRKEPKGDMCCAQSNWENVESACPVVPNQDICLMQPVAGPSVRHSIQSHEGRRLACLLHLVMMALVSSNSLLAPAVFVIITSIAFCRMAEGVSKTIIPGEHLHSALSVSL